VAVKGLAAVEFLSEVEHLARLVCAGFEIGEVECGDVVLQVEVALLTVVEAAEEEELVVEEEGAAAPSR
jgi:hypothetical protein